MSTTHTIVDSPLGEITLVARDGGLAGLYFSDHRRRPTADALGRRSAAGFEEAIRQLTEYFRGERRRFDLPLAPEGTAFQKRVWQQLRAIPYGETRSYRELAAELQGPALARAVGTANGRNPLSVIVPCHRVVATGGKLAGYAGGVERKRLLLELESAVVAADDARQSVAAQLVQV